jgi:hypothetical protein
VRNPKLDADFRARRRMQADPESILATEHCGTPEWIMDIARAMAGVKRFDFDPCWNEWAVDTARVKLTKETNGLLSPWPRGSGYINPPFSTFGQTVAHTRAHEHSTGGRGPVVVLTPLNSGSKNAQWVYSAAYAGGFLVNDSVRFLDRGSPAKQGAPFIVQILGYPTPDDRSAFADRVYAIAETHANLIPIFTRPMLGYAPTDAAEAG